MIYQIWSKAHQWLRVPRFQKNNPRWCISYNAEASNEMKLTQKLNCSTYLAATFKTGIKGTWLQLPSRTSTTLMTVDNLAVICKVGSPNTTTNNQWLLGMKGSGQCKEPDISFSTERASLRGSHVCNAQSNSMPLVTMISNMGLSGLEAVRTCPLVTQN